MEIGGAFSRLITPAGNYLRTINSTKTKNRDAA